MTENNLFFSGENDLTHLKMMSVFREKLIMEYMSSCESNGMTRIYMAFGTTDNKQEDEIK